MALSEQDVVRGIDKLRDKRLMSMLATAGGRVPKYEHRLDNYFEFTPQELGTLCVLLLRGAQTAAEIRTRTHRICEFESVAEVETVLRELSSREGGPFVVQLPQLPGQREKRYQHLFCGEIDFAALQESRVEPVTSLDEDRISALEEQVRTVRGELMALQEQFAAFRRQFE